MQNGKNLGKNFSAVLLSANIKTSAETLGKVMLQTVANFHAITCMSIQIPPRLYLGHVPKGRTFKFISCKMNRKTEEENLCQCLKSNLSFFFPLTLGRFRTWVNTLPWESSTNQVWFICTSLHFEGEGISRQACLKKESLQDDKRITLWNRRLFLLLSCHCLYNSKHHKIKHALKTNFSFLKWTTQK